MKSDRTILIQDNLFFDCWHNDIRFKIFFSADNYTTLQNEGPFI